MASNFRRTWFRGTWLFVACIVAAGSGTAHSQASRKPRVLVVGWHDEFNTLDNWAPWTAFGGFDILRGDDGKLSVVLGKTAMQDANFHNLRAGVYQDFEVDVARYPVVAVRVLGMHQAASWDAQVGEFRDESLPDAREPSEGGFLARPGNLKQLVLDPIGDCGALRKPGLVFIQLKPSRYSTPGKQSAGKQSAGKQSAGKQHVRLLLNANGLPQGSVSFAWVRFVRREDVVGLRAHPDDWTVR